MSEDIESPPLTDGRLIYAIGDVHGRLDAFHVLLQLIVSDAAERATPAKPIMVLLGDYVDRGPDSRRVLEVIVSLCSARDWEVICLMGNHEQALLKFLDDAQFGPEWASYGGVATLVSYGVAAPRLRSDAKGWARTRAEFEATLPEAHGRLLRGLKAIEVIGDFAFVHAGLRPNVPLADQSEDDLLWIREPFLSTHTPHEKVVVHGHTPAEEPFNGAYRIGVDTGAHATGRLTAVRLEGSKRSFLQTALGGTGGRSRQVEADLM